MIEITNFAQAKEALASYLPRTNAARHTQSLEAMRRLLQHLGNPQEQLRVIHVAGTSGKTSTAYYAAAALHASGRRVGLTVSPHVDEINERVQLDMQPLSEAAYCTALSRFLQLVQTAPVAPTYFELLAAFALWYFAQKAVEYAVVEVGIGGLLDSTNVLRAPEKVCVITDIGLDHTRLLGNTLAEIAAQKAGIIHPGNQVFCYEQTAEIMQPISRAAAQSPGAALHVVPQTCMLQEHKLPLFQQRNFGLAAAAANYVLTRDGHEPLSGRSLELAATTAIPARMEIRTLHGKIIVLDAAHNPQKLTALCQSVQAQFAGQEVALMTSFLRGHLRQKVAAVQGLSNHTIVTGFARLPQDPYESAPPKQIAQLYQEAGGVGACEVIPQVADALQALLRRPEPVLLITGSFYLLNHVRPLLLAAAATPAQ